jgi:hypothetical protein
MRRGAGARGERGKGSEVRCRVRKHWQLATQFAEKGVGVGEGSTPFSAKVKWLTHRRCTYIPTVLNLGQLGGKRWLKFSNRARQWLTG